MTKKQQALETMYLHLTNIIKDDLIMYDDIETNPTQRQYLWSHIKSNSASALVLRYILDGKTNVTLENIRPDTIYTFINELSKIQVIK